MIALLRGRVAASAAGELVIDVGGVGYRVLVSDVGNVGKAGAVVTLHTHLVVREDALTLYGFPTPQERELFATLLSVGGVGPKLALTALGRLGADGLRRAVATEDVLALTLVPGIGRKGAQRIILELRERLGVLVPSQDAAAWPPAADTVPTDGHKQEVRLALASLGYAPAEIHAALDRLAADDAGDGPEALLRAALRTLGG